MVGNGGFSTAGFSLRGRDSFPNTARVCTAEWSYQPGLPIPHGYRGSITRLRLCISIALLTTKKRARTFAALTILTSSVGVGLHLAYSSHNPFLPFFRRISSKNLFRINSSFSPSLNSSSISSSTFKRSHSSKPWKASL